MSEKPNVILILVDDMGFADLGITGSEIRTPNIDQLGTDGALLTAMYNCARCCPTRASLLTGLYPHNAGIGHLLAALKRLNQYDNTLILFLSDNGGCAEFMAEDGWAQYYPDTTLSGQKITMGNIPNLRPGDALTFQSYDKPWANVSNAPFRLYKHYVHEGGISTPLIVHWPKRITGGQTSHTPCHVVDILPTILQATGGNYPAEFGGHEIQPLQGESLLDLLLGKDWNREQPIFFEHEGNSAIRLNNFKLVRKHGADWELYDMDEDRTELNNLAGRNRTVENDLRRQYHDWADKSGILDWKLIFPKLLEAWKLDGVDG